MSSSPKTSPVAALSEGRFLLDGAMGTSLMKLGLKSAEVPLASLTEPAAVEGIHRGFLRAGCRLIQTNTFAANRLALARGGADQPVGALNRRAVELARGQVEAHGSGWVAGNIGPVGAWGDAPGEGILERTYEEQGSALVEAGVDLLTLETFGGAGDACLALRVLRQLSDLPILVSFTFVSSEAGFVTLDKEPLLAALQRVEQAGAAVVGVNCADGSAQTLACVRELEGKLGVPLSAKPNVGVPSGAAGRRKEPQSPEQFARDMFEATRCGVAAVGGCCGADERYLAALGALLEAAD